MVTKLSSYKVFLATVLGFVVFRSFTLLPMTDNENKNDRPGLESSYSIPDQYLDKNAFDGKSINQSLIFVHIGKTGGETIQWRLKLSCSLRKSRRLKAICTDQFARGESYVSKATIGYAHCDKVKPKEINFQNATSFMISTRDPIRRIISWFQYMHPLNCLRERPSAACNLKKGNNSWGLAFYRDCFPQVNDFIEALKVSRVVGAINCSEMALETLQGNGPPGESNHMHFNYMYYANKTTLRYPEKDIMVVRQERLWDDLRSVEAILGGDSFRPFETEGRVVTHFSELFPYKSELDPSFIPSLCCVIPNEISIYTYLLERAKNLQVLQKKETINILLNQCNAKSMTELSARCGW